MESSIWKQAAKFLRDKKLNRRWLMVFACLAVIVAAGTVTALKYNGQAMTYKQKVLDCGYQVHKHTASCYDKENKLVCGQADYVVHVHNDDCYSLNGKLVCTLPEVKEHKHDSSCYKDEATLICNQAESAGHVHDDSCYTTERGDLICGTEEHQHGDSCYNENGELTCTQAEHRHSDECYAVNRVLTCTQEEGAGGHTHTDSCYKIEKVLACGKLENHTHTKSCYDENGKLICGKTVLEEHVHSDECFKVVEMTPEEIAAMSAPYETDSAEEAEDSAEESGIFFTDVDGETDAEDSSLEGSAYEDESKLDEEPEAEYHWLSDSGSDYTVTVATPEGALPENAELAVQEIARDTAEYESYYKQMVETLLKQSEAESEEELELKNPRFFDISFMVDGEEVEPTEPVVVNISYQNGDEWENAVAVHFAEDGESEQLPLETSEDGYRFVGKSFSVYGLGDSVKGAAAVAGEDLYDALFGGVSTLADSSTKTVEFYVRLDDAWVKIATRDVAMEVHGGYYCIAPSTLETVYADYGFKTTDVTRKSYLFGYSGRGTTIYVNHDVQRDNMKNLWVPTLRSDDERVPKVYYLPGNTEKENIPTTDPVPQSSSFYSISVYRIESGTTIEGYVLAGKNKTLTLEGKPEDWECSDATATLTEKNGETEVKLTNVTAPVTLLQLEQLGEGEKRIIYDANVTLASDEQVFGEGPAVRQQALYTEIITAEQLANYTLLSPDKNSYLVSSTGANARRQYVFDCWTLNGKKATNEAVQEALANSSTVTLKARWSRKDSSTTINFYVNYTPIKLGFTEKVVNDQNWTPSLYAAQLIPASEGAEIPDMIANNVATRAGVVLGDEEGTVKDLYGYDQTIREFGRGTVFTSQVDKNYKDGQFKIDRFPKDAEILAGIKANSSYLKTIGIEADELTTDNYTIYWNIFKGGTGDEGWHVDGRLVQKKGKLVVKKTFAGAAPMEELKKTFEINITGTAKDGKEFKLDPLTLTDPTGEHEVAATAAGVSNFTIKEETNTYIWELELPQLVDYTIKETGYARDQDNLVCQAKYQVQNRPEGSDTGLTEYDEDQGVSVKVTNYPVGTPQSGIQTAALENYYVTSNSFLLVKRDDSGELLAGVKFSFMKDGKKVTLYKENDNHYYLYEPPQIKTTPVEELVTTKNGVTVHGLNDERVKGLYVMAENAQTGYQQLNKIEFKIQEGGSIVETPDSEKDADWSQVGGTNAYNLQVKNTSERADFTVTKVWGLGTVKKDVTLQLYRDEAPMTGSEYTVKMEATEDQTWTYTWNVPTHVGGEKAAYTVREIAIDGKEPSANPSYRITYSDVTEATVTEKAETTMHYAQTVTNSLNTGKVSFTKIDAQSGEGLAGAKFELVPVTGETGEQISDTKQYTATSGADGQVIFDDVPPGTYTMKEIEAPAGFVKSEEEYTVTVTANASGQNTVTIQNKDNVEIGEIKNDVISVPLPESGGPGTTLYTFGGIALLAVCLVYGCSMRRRRERRAE